MRLFSLFALVLFLCTPCWAEKTWTSKPDRLSLNAGDDFQKHGNSLKGSTLDLFSAKKNAQLILSMAEIPKPAGASSTPIVSTADFIKAFPVLSTEKKLTVHAGPIKVKAGGVTAAIYEVENEAAAGYQTVYAYVGRGKMPYTLILNYPSPRNPEMVKLMQQVLGSVKHL